MIVSSFDGVKGTRHLEHGTLTSKVLLSQTAKHD